MKRLSTLGLAALAMAFVTSAQAVVIYDTVTPAGTTPTFYTGVGNQRSADNFALATAGTGLNWNISQLDFVGVASAAGTLTNVSVTVNVYNGVNVTGVAADPAFSSLAGTATANFGDLTAAAVGTGFNFQLTGLDIDLAAAPVNPASGYAIELIWSNGGAGTISSLYKQAGSVAAGSLWSNGFYVDIDNNGVLTNNNFVNFTNWQNGNMALKVTAEAVPEPATMAVLGLGLAAIARRRRKN